MSFDRAHSLVSVSKIVESLESFVIQLSGLILGGLPVWTQENRPRYNRDHLRYPSDLTEDWEEAERVIVALKTAIEQARRGEPDSRVLSLPILGGLHHLYV